MTALKGNTAFQARSLVCACPKPTPTHKDAFPSTVRYTKLHIYLCKFSLRPPGQYNLRVAAKIRTVPFPPPPSLPIRRLQLPRIRQKEDTRCVPGTSRRGGREKDTGTCAEGIEGVAGHEGGFRQGFSFAICSIKKRDEEGEQGFVSSEREKIEFTGGRQHAPNGLTERRSR